MVSAAHVQRYSATTSVTPGSQPPACLRSTPRTERTPAPAASKLVVTAGHDAAAGQRRDEPVFHARHPGKDVERRIP